MALLSNADSPLLAAVYLVCGLCLLTGLLLTWLGAVTALLFLGGALGWLPPAQLGNWLPAPTELFGLLVALALVLLGPGANSLDAKLFGRREVIIPERNKIRKE